MTPYKRAEYYLHNYERHKTRLEQAAEQLQTLRAGFDVRAQNYTNITRQSGGKSDPVASYVELCLLYESVIAQLTRYVQPVDRVKEYLAVSTDFRADIWCAILTLHYLRKMSLRNVAFHLQRHPSTVYRRREELVRLVVSEIAESERKSETKHTECAILPDNELM